MRLNPIAMHLHCAHPRQCTGQLICRLAVWRLVLVAPPAAMDWRHLVGNSPTYCGTLAQYIAHSTITQHTDFPTHRDRPNAEPSVKDADQLAKSLFIRRRIPAKNCAAYICSDFETTLPFTTPEYVAVVLCSSNHGLPLNKYTKTNHHNQFHFSQVAYCKNV